MKKLLLIMLVIGLLAMPAIGQRIKSFCEFGTGIALQLGAGGAIWEESWGYDSWDWYDCQAAPNIGFLNEHVVGELITTTAGAPTLDENYILEFPFGGELTLTALSGKKQESVVGQIWGTVEGLFVADLNAEHAIVGDNGIIVVLFGSSLHDEPDALIHIMETSGKFKSIQPAGPWQWYVNGYIYVLRIPEMPLQLNILAALSPDYAFLLLGADEEIVLTGQYYRSKSK